MEFELKARNLDHNFYPMQKKTVCNYLLWFVWNRSLNIGGVSVNA
jgi:hypothetical protein